MKRNIYYIVLLICFYIMGMEGCSKHDTIYFEDLPAVAQSFLERYFPENKVASAEHHVEEPCYAVILDNGYEVDFYNDGRWQSINSRHAILPAELVQAILPEKMLTYLSETFPDDGISAVERSVAGYNLELATTPVVVLYFDPLGNTTADIED